MLRNALAVVVAVGLLTPMAVRAADKFTIKEAETAVPEGVNKAVAEQLAAKTVQLLDDKGAVMYELWFRKEIPSTANEQQAKSGLTYSEIQETSLVAVMKLYRPTTDYRKNKIKEGVYTLRLATQPSDGDHMGTAPHPNFCLMIPVADDKKPDALAEAKALHELSTKSTGSSHPGVWLLFPGKDPGNAPKLVTLPDNHWVLMWKQDVKVKEMKASLIFGLCLVGTSGAV